VKATNERARTGWRVLLFVFLLLVSAITGSQAQTSDFCDGTGIITNENQLAAAYNCDVFGLMFGPPEFRVWLTWPQWFWTDFAPLPPEFGAAFAQSKDQIQGVTVLKVRLTRAILDGTTLVEFGTNSLTLAAPAGYSATNATDSAMRSALYVWRQWIEWGELDENTQPTLRLDIALADVKDKAAFEAAEALAWEEAQAKEAEAGAGMLSATTESEGGGMYGMESGSCTITDEAGPFSILGVQQDTNRWTTITWESCSDHIYGVFSIDDLQTNWIGRVSMWVRIAAPVGRT
jgi:hypothetical protein